MRVLNSSVNASGASDLYQFTQGLDMDVLLYRQEIAVQKVWVIALMEGGYLSSDEANQLITALDDAKELINVGEFEWREEDEDIHMNLERHLTEVLGETGKKLHYGRSRNDLIATTLRLYVSDCMKDVEGLVGQLKNNIAEKSLEALDIIVPGMTHLQFGQPVRMGHVFSAHAQGLKRDLKKMDFIKGAPLSECPLGAAAFAGSTVAVDLAKVASDLGFENPCQNSYDSVGDRDFILDALQVFSSIAVHLSRLAEEVMFWSASPVKVMNLPKDYSTGSSIMPNKRNPDIVELVRAKMARVIAASTEGASLVRSVTPSYGSDLHELKRTFILSHGEISSSLKILAPFVAGLSFNKTAAEKLLMTNHILATEVANELCQKGVTFRDAYTQVAEMVALADQKGLQVHEVAQADLGIEVSFEGAVEARNLPGGTAYAQAESSIKKLLDQ